MTARARRQRTLWDPAPNPYATNYRDHRHQWQATDEWLMNPSMFEHVDMRCATCGAAELPPLGLWFWLAFGVFVIGTILSVIITPWFWAGSWVGSGILIYRHERREKKWYENHISNL